MHARSIIKALLAAFGATAAVAQTSTSSAAPSSTSIVPNIVDGHSNESAAIIPIDYSLARSIIPSNYSIMVDAYESLIPNWPKGKYPALFSLAYETNDTTGGQLVVSNLTRVAIRFPFVDRLHGTGIPFRFANVILIQAPISNIIGSLFLQATFQGTCEPRLGALAPVKGTNGHKTHSTCWNGTDEADGKPASWQTLITEGVQTQWPISVFKNITNQPVFGAGSIPELCLVYRFNQSVFDNAPSFSLDVTVRPPYLPKKASFKNASGLHIPSPFEETFTSCESVPGLLSNSTSAR